MKKHERKFSGILGLLGFVLIVIIVFYLIKTLAQSNNSSVINSSATLENKTKTYISKNLKFKIEVPKEFQISNTGITIILSKSNEEINISRNGTQYNTLDEYLKDSDIKANIEIINKTSIKINDLNARSRIERSKFNQASRYKIYYIYVGNAVYTLSTKIESLFDDLDQIAQSFRYVE